MCYGSGTSYATPHVASAAMMWKALHQDYIRKNLREGWQVVEAFRTCLAGSARKPSNWPAKFFGIYGAGVLDITALLKFPIDGIEKNLKPAYQSSYSPKKWDLGIRESVHKIWNVLKRKLSKDPTESFTGDMILSDRARRALNQFAPPGDTRATESSATPALATQEELLRVYFKSYSK